MARRYGGKYSPGVDGAEAAPDAGTARPFDGKTRSRAGARVNALFLLPFPFIISAFRAEAAGLALNLACFGLLMAAAWLTREGVLAEEAYAARSTARRPAWPRKIMGAVALGAGLGLAGLADGSLVNAIIFAALGGALHLMAFGLDPLRDKGMGDVDRFQSDRVMRAVREAESHLAAMSEAVARTGDRKVEARVERFQTTARKMFRTVEDDPRDLTAARKFLGVYLIGARDAAVKFSDLYRRTRDAGAREDFVALLDDLESNFAAKTETLLLDDRSDLDVEIGVLRERIGRELR